MTEKEFSSHVLYVSGQKNNAGNKTGARCVVDVLVTAGLLAEENGKLAIATPNTDAPPAVKDVPAVDVQLQPQASSPSHASPVAMAAAQIPPSLPTLTAAVPQIAINIQLHLPETENAEVYEKLFKALRENLLEPKSA